MRLPPETEHFRHFPQKTLKKILKREIRIGIILVVNRLSLYGAVGRNKGG